MSKFRTFGDRVICADGEFGETRTAGGIIVQDTYGKSEGIVPRWFRVFEVGDEIDYVKPGDWILVEQGRWTEKFWVDDARLVGDADKKKYLWMVESSSILAVSDEKPDAVNLNSDTVTAFRKTLEA